MLLVGAGAVGESILRILQSRDPDGKWLEKVVVSDCDLYRAQEVVGHLQEDERFVAEYADAREKDQIVALIQKYQCDFVMDAAAPYVCNNIFDASYEGGVNYGNMGTWSVPRDNPKLGLGIENSYIEPMTKYNFDRHKDWQKKGIMACICLGVDPGVVNVFAKFAAVYLFDEIHEIHVKDGGNLTIPGADKDTIIFGFNVWTVLDECINPNIEWDKEKGGFIVEGAFAGEETFEMPAGVGLNTLVKVEHEETVTMPRYLEQYGLKKCTFKIALDDNLVQALKVISSLGLRSLHPIHVSGVEVVPRDVVAAAAPQPKDLGSEMLGKMCVGVHCKGIKDGKTREVFIYQPFDNQISMHDWKMQAVVAQTGFGAAVGIELIAKGVWKDAGVFSPEYFDPIPYLEIMDEAGFEYGIVEMESQYKTINDKKIMAQIFTDAANLRKLAAKLEKR
ncbi:saccharopine dehydrogenase NADP-binding domain-containing protein [Clostridiales bacterium BAD-6]|uniref:Saccharopine dehydrogenase NADP-binding domain-containing protein n=2 Tax=Sinanaerobacter chloroacetimidivorans TaxID=2818044 RepID=A0A8J7VZV3_9FIRM|nr:saccharopine dehydrogenase NADP-binding domain-containing protein [Sinanaerobacter chloroacetimidivorans]